MIAINVSVAIGQLPIRQFCSFRKGLVNGISVVRNVFVSSYRVHNITPNFPVFPEDMPPYLPGRCPLFGHIFANLFDPAKPHLGLTELAKKYGDIFTMQVKRNLTFSPFGKYPICRQ